MSIEYNKEKSIAIMELSSSGIKTISASPFHIRKKHDLSKFSDNRVVILNLFQIIDKNLLIDENRFISEFLPEIIKHYKLIRNSRNPQAFKIIATGYYRIVKNSDKILSIIIEAIQNVSIGNSFSVQLLSMEEESKLSFTAWYNTYKFNLEEEELFNTNKINKLIGLHIDVGGATTEISQIKNINDFSNTISLLSEITKISECLSENINISTELIDTEIDSMRNTTIDFISHNYLNTVTDKIDYCIVTGSYTLTSKDFFILNNSEKLSSNNVLGLIAELKEKLTNQLYKENNEKTKIIKQILSLTVLRAILRWIKIDFYYPNQANLRIGCYYDVLKKLRSNENPYA